ncbi:MAG: nucleoside kinase [Lachnospirales bacterium]
MITTNYNNNKIELPKGSTFLDLISLLKKDNKLNFDSEPIVAKTNNVLVDLNREVLDGSTVSFVEVTDYDGYLAFQRSISFMAYVAIKEIFGEKARMVVKHSISKSFYCHVEGIDVTEADVVKINEHMDKMVEEDVPIYREHIRVDTAYDLMEKFNNPVRRDLIKYEVESSIVLYSLKGVYNFFYDVLASSCSGLKNFEVAAYKDGFVIVFPTRDNLDEERGLELYDKVSAVFEESAEWAKVLKASNVAGINNHIENDRIDELIRINETLHEKKLTKLAESICKDHKKLVLIAGPSSSGKTTFSKRLCVHLQVNGLMPVVIGLDDYYKNRDDIPVDENGKRNFEVIETLEIDMINRDLSELLEGKEVEIPHFNFVTGEKEWKGNKVKLKENSIIIIEGIHGLNDELTKLIPKELKFKIFIAALTQINVDDINRIATRDTRLIRRIVRDHKFRGFHALTTIAMWQDVLKGESDNIFPYQEEADAVFNSALVYELAILKNYVLPILFKVESDDVEYSECRRLIKFLKSVLSIPAEMVPSTSIIREFVGGSIYE